MPSDPTVIAEMLKLPELPQEQRQKRRFFLLDGSPLARKIIVFNLIGLGILLASILYLNQSNDGLVSYRRASLARQTVEVSQLFTDQLGSLSEERAKRQFFETITRPTGTVGYWYSPAAELRYKSIPLALPVDAGATSVVSSQSALSRLLQGLWGDVDGQEIAGISGNIQTKLENLIQQNNSLGQKGFNEILIQNGETYIVVGQSVFSNQVLEGYVILSTLDGEIDAIVRNSREQILEMFVLAILSSIILSLVLANSIARPLRRLSAAADTTHLGMENRLNPARLDIPDLSARPDEIGDLSRAMRNMTGALVAQIDKTKSFSADVSHEIKNPLTSLRSAVETMDYALDEESRQALLGVIREDVDRIDRLITDISNASRLEAELVREEWEAINLDQTLNGMANYYDGKYQDKHLTVTFETDGNNHVIKGLGGRLEQVFTNLITNAISFIPDGGWVKISASTSGGGHTEIRILDNGPGIPPDNLDDVFSRFYSERPAEQFGEHSGLGLAISRQIVEAHGGQVIATNHEEYGAEFIIDFPQ